MLEKELGLESDMKLSVYNVQTSSGGKEKPEIIGECSVPITSLTNKCDRPQYFNLINEEGMFVGQVLANFYLKVDPKDIKNKNKDQKVVERPLLEVAREMFAEALRPRYEVDITFSLFGIRNLINKAISPVVRARLTNDSGGFREIRLDDNVGLAGGGEFDPTHPNFGTIVKFSNVSLESEPLAWPFLEIEVTDMAAK